MNKLEQAQEIYQTFPDRFESLMLSTVSADGIPNASYAPFVRDERKNFYIYVSGLSTHTQNLHATSRASILLIDDESETSQIFARRRLTFDCSATLLDRDRQSWTQIADEFADRFGEIVGVLRGLADFRIFQLTPSGGRFAIGFGAAYQIDPQNLDRLVHLGK
ncbi:MAG: pyridoxamine 5'-phosphate oxidase family protein [Cyanobacteriota bacterium]|nr:pyridoxamine 5'-phosphate oxidase family protein [Cyanobacteriota bacterium]